MEPPGDRTEVVDKNEEPAEDKAAVQTPATSKSVTRRRELRERGAGRPRPGVSASLTDLNGAASSTGRVLRNRSTRAVPAWLKDSKSDDEEDDASIVDMVATKRRKVSSSRRKRHSESVGSAEAGGGPAGDSLQGTE